MTSQKRPGSRTTQGGPKPQRQSTDPAAGFLPPLKPRPILMIVLAVVLALWLVALVIMRQTTIRPAASPQNSLPSPAQ